MQFFNDDKSVNKEVSHLRLKSELLQNERFLLEKSFTKQDMISIAKIYTLNLSIRKKKDELNAELVKKVLENPNSAGTIPTHQEVAGPSSQSTASVENSTLAPMAVQQVRKRNSYKKGKKKGKRKAESSHDDSDEKCAVCNSKYADGEQWICCDECSMWYHRQCVQINNDNEWARLMEDGEPYSCPMCQ